MGDTRPNRFAAIFQQLAIAAPPNTKSAVINYAEFANAIASWSSKWREKGQVDKNSVYNRLRPNLERTMSLGLNSEAKAKDSSSTPSGESQLLALAESEPVDVIILLASCVQYDQITSLLELSVSSPKAMVSALSAILDQDQQLRSILLGNSIEKMATKLLKDEAGTPLEKRLTLFHQGIALARAKPLSVVTSPATAPQGALPQAVVQHSASPTISLFWIGIPDETEILHQSTTGIPVSPRVASALNDMDMKVLLQPELVDQLEKSLGLAFIGPEQSCPGKTDLDEGRWLHQSIVTLMFMLNSPNCPFRLERALSWQGLDLSKFEDLLLGSQSNQPSSSQHQPKTLVFLSRTGYPSEKALSLQAFYSRMRLISAVHGNLEVCPPEEEFLFKEDKGDPPDDGSSLDDNSGKGTFAAAIQFPHSFHIVKQMSNNPDPSGTGTTKKFVPALRDFGELCVFVRGPGPATSRIIIIVRVKPNDNDISGRSPGPEITFQQLRPSDFHWLATPDERAAKYDELCRFAVYVMMGWWYTAGYYSYATLAPPWLDVCAMGLYATSRGSSGDSQMPGHAGATQANDREKAQTPGVAGPGPELYDFNRWHRTILAVGIVGIARFILLLESYDNSYKFFV
ncbi:hypothetical protein QBC33DRAFT_520135 [Phialemonium atrogriseum]|uniref:Uncharacterized protein n=1 Tax=Phialemonium atrogriseum TaxID=1093897 RepID=A0AAJ0BP68_9PEZI|nr:uncharacterized protein QBC33DRAFT_520135 [Phialemonium atrogriseum]KAK1761776.1 hypothetical protein QBC33DRAFT_520135 [Phialemonium atrogriseum]